MTFHGLARVLRATPQVATVSPAASRGVAPHGARLSARPAPRLTFRLAQTPLLAPPALKVSHPSDVSEQTAARHAQAVMQPGHPGTVRPGASHGGMGQVLAPDQAAQVQEAVGRNGQPLDTAVRAAMEPRFGTSFADVRVHADAEAAASARRLDARAYTLGRDIVFGPGAYAPTAPTGQMLLAHELSHVAWQRRSGLSLVQRQMATRPAPDEAHREFVRDTIGFLQRSTEFYNEPNVRVTASVFDRVITSWYAMIVRQDEEIDRSLGGDAALRRDVRAAYSAAISTLVRRAAASLGRSEADLYEANRGRIPMWAWPTPSHLVAGITTPVPAGVTPAAGTGAVTLMVNGVTVVILPDIFDPRPGTRALTGLNIRGTVPAYQPGAPTAQPPTAEFVIQTTYPAGVRPGGRSAYGRGTTAEDVAGGRITPASTSLGFHEGSHGLGYIEYFRRHAPPAFTGHAGMTATEWDAAADQWQAAMTAYGAQAGQFGTRQGDCAGVTIDVFNRAHPTPGQRVILQCPAPAAPRP